MKKVAIAVLLLMSVGAFGQNQQEEMVSVPKSKLTDQQKADLKIDSAKSWIGLGDEIGKAVNGTLAAVTTQSNNFAQTSVGKLTVVLVIWKILGDQALHVLGGIIEILLLVPIWIWSFRRMCFTRRLKKQVVIGADKVKTISWQIVEYDTSGYADATPRIVHCIAIAALVGLVLATVFSY
jgi:hypothetical protein